MQPAYIGVNRAEVDGRQIRIDALDQRRQDESVGGVHLLALTGKEQRTLRIEGNGPVVAEPIQP